MSDAIKLIPPTRYDMGTIRKHFWAPSTFKYLIHLISHGILTQELPQNQYGLRENATFDANSTVMPSIGLCNWTSETTYGHRLTAFSCPYLILRTGVYMLSILNFQDPAIWALPEWHIRQSHFRYNAIIIMAYVTSWCHTICTQKHLHMPFQRLSQGFKYTYCETTVWHYLKCECM